MVENFMRHENLQRLWGCLLKKKTQDGDKVQRKKTENGEKPVEKRGKTRAKKKLPSLIIEIGHRWPREVDQKRAY